MDYQADINWIKAELDKVKDPYLIEVFKSLLRYREHSARKDFNQPDSSLSNPGMAGLNHALWQIENGDLFLGKMRENTSSQNTICSLVKRNLDA